MLANLPYIPSWEIEALEPEVSKYEPLVALDGGVDGFVLIAGSSPTARTASGRG